MAHKGITTFMEKEMTQKRVLVVEDEFLVAEGMRRTLQKFGYAVVDVIASGAEAVQSAIQNQPDIVLMDIQLQGPMNGIQAAAKIRSQCDIPVIYLTAHSDETVVQEAKTTEAFGYLLKPVNQRELRSSLEIALYKHDQEQRLRESEKRYRNLFDGVPVGVYRTTPQGQLLDANRTLVEMLGYPNISSLLAVNVMDLYVYPEQREQFNQLAQHQNEIQGFEVQLYRQDGTSIWGQLNTRIVRENNGGVSHYEGAIVNITKRKQAEAAVMHLRHQNEVMMQTMIDTLPQGICLLSPDRHILLTNPAARKYLEMLCSKQKGDTLTHVGGHSLSELLLPPLKGTWHEIQMSGRNFNIAAHRIEKSSQPAPSRKAIYPESEPIEGWVLVIHDVTQEQETQHYIEQQARLATVGQLAAGIAHDFNNILAVITLYARMSLRNPELPDDIHDRLKVVDQQAQRASELIQQILDFSRRAALERRPMDLLVFLKEQTKMLERALPENINIQLTYDPGEYKVSADPTRMQQAIVNLAVNARDAMPDGGELQIKLDNIEVSQDTPPPLPDMAAGHWIHIAVTDTGTGIEQDVLPYIFDPFFTTKNPDEGTGLGLAQVHSIVKSHDGHVNVQTAVNQGSTFSIYLPRMQEQTASEHIVQESALVHGHGETILLVEDNDATRQALVDGLELLNYRVVQAVNGQQALDIFKQHMTQTAQEKIALVLSDVVMPDTGGQALFQSLKALAPNTKVILMTGHPLTQELKALQAQGLTGWLSKPLSLEQLSEVIAQALKST